MHWQEQEGDFINQTESCSRGNATDQHSLTTLRLSKMQDNTVIYRDWQATECREMCNPPPNWGCKFLFIRSPGLLTTRVYNYTYTCAATLASNLNKSELSGDYDHSEKEG